MPSIDMDPTINDKALRIMYDFMQKHKYECLYAIKDCKSQEEAERILQDLIDSKYKSTVQLTMNAVRKKKTGEKTDLSLYDCDTNDDYLRYWILM